MKKIILLLTLTVVIHLNTKAQNNLLADAVYQAAFTSNRNYPNNLTSATTIYSLSDTTGVVKDHAYYKKKSKDLRSVGLGFLGAGVLLSGIGLLVIGSNDVSSNDAGTGLAIMGLGAIAGIISIPLMVTAHVNKHKARLLLKSQKTGFGVPGNVSKDIVGVTFKIAIGN